MVAALPSIARAFPDRPIPRPPPALGALLHAARLTGADLGFAAIDVASGAVIADRAGAVLRPPASTLKVVTALYALDRLSPGHRFATRVLRDGDTLILAGGGDPTLDSDRLAELAARSAAAAGNWRPARLLVWDGALPGRAEIAAGQAPQVPYNPAVSGIMLNFNRVELGWRCPSQGTCTLTLAARGEHVAAPARTISATQGRGYVHGEDGGSERWTVPPVKGRGTRWLPVRNPALYAGDFFRSQCAARGLVLPAPERLGGPAPRGAELARTESEALPQILREMLLYSTNLTAEAVGLAASRAPDAEGSAAAMSAWLADQGAGTAELADHSGLSPASRIAPMAMARLFALVRNRQQLALLLKTDPLSDVLGRQSGGADTQVAVRGKTGTLNFVSNLVGYAAGGSSEIAFACMVEDAERHAATSGEDLPAGVIGWTARAKALQRDAVAATLATLNRRPRPLPPEI